MTAAVHDGIDKEPTVAPLTAGIMASFFFGPSAAPGLNRDLLAGAFVAKRR